MEAPKEPSKKLSTPKKVPERTNPELLDRLPIASPVEPRQTAAQNYRGEFASAAGGGVDGGGVFVGNPAAKGEFAGSRE